jgi:hypothetical protein
MKHRSIVPLFVFALAAAGCSSPTDDEESSTTESLEVVTNRPAPPWPPDVAGPARFLLDVTRAEIDLRSDQRRRLLSIETELDGVSKPLNLDRQAIEKKLTLALRVGELDATSTQSSIEELARRVEADAPAQVRAIDALWETLDAVQRQAVAETVRSRPRPPTVDEPPERPLGPFFGGLELTAEQHAALLRVALPPPRKDDPLDLLVAVFANDGFRAEKVLSSADLVDRAKKHLSQHLAMTQTLLRVLDDEQRAKLAKRMERAPT